VQLEVVVGGVGVGVGGEVVCSMVMIREEI